MSALKRMESMTVQLVGYAVHGCGHMVWLDEDHVREIKKTKESFYCPRCGNTNYFPAKTEEQKLRAELEHQTKLTQWAKMEAKHSENRRRAEKAAKTRIKNRIAKGVCPCCNRAFENVQRHMATKHPDYTEQES